MVDEVRLSRLMRAASDGLASLGREAEAPPQRRSDPLWRSGVKYLFITTIEACVDIAQHVCASEGWGPPATNADAFRVLATHDVVPADLAHSLAHAVGFRNVLVHDYVDVDEQIVDERLTDLSDLESFLRTVAVWLTE